MMPKLPDLKKGMHPLLDLWNKANNDWIFNLAGLIAYNLLMSIFPILVALIGIMGAVLGGFGPAVQQQIILRLQHSLPGGTASNLLPYVYHSLSQSSPYLLAAGIISAVWFGSRLFVTLEGVLGIIYRVPQRGFLRQNIMALAMMLFFIVMVPIIIGASLLPAALGRISGGQPGGAIQSALVLLSGIVVSLLFAFLLFEAILVVVPNRKVRLREATIGALIGAVLLEIYTVVFPYYAAYGLHANDYGAAAGFAIVLLIFFYYFAFILLIAAEVNSYLSGERPTAAPLPAMLHQVQQHRTVAKAAGPETPEPHKPYQGTGQRDPDEVYRDDVLR
jgi:membrane protein